MAGEENIKGLQLTFHRDNTVRDVARAAESEKAFTNFLEHLSGPVYPTDAYASDTVMASDEKLLSASRDLLAQAAQTGKLDLWVLSDTSLEQAIGSHTSIVSGPVGYTVVSGKTEGERLAVLLPESFGKLMADGSYDPVSLNCTHMAQVYCREPKEANL